MILDKQIIGTLHFSIQLSAIRFKIFKFEFFYRTRKKMNSKINLNEFSKYKLINIVNILKYQNYKILKSIVLKIQFTLLEIKL